MIDKLKKLLISSDADLKTALRQMDDGAEKILFVVEKAKILKGVLSDGDIRRWIISTGDLKGVVRQFCNLKPIYVKQDYSIDEVKELMITKKIEAIPVITDHGEIIDVLLWENVFSESKRASTGLQLNVPVAIMAGGKGTRLDPFTRILPKPLIPIGNKPIIEIIIDNFREYNVSQFYITVNYKSKMIKSYFDELTPEYDVHFIEESQPLGTAGSLKYLDGKIKDTFIVSNCDIIIDTDYPEMLNYHKDKKNLITMVASLKHYHIPYGICEIENGGTLRGIKEKPEYSFLVNTGMYIVEPEVLSYLKKDEPIDFTDLIKSINAKAHKVGVFPISEKSWIDTGEWEEYKKSVQQLTL